MQEEYPKSYYSGQAKDMEAKRKRRRSASVLLIISEIIIRTQVDSLKFLMNILKMNFQIDASISLLLYELCIFHFNIVFTYLIKNFDDIILI